MYLESLDRGESLSLEQWESLIEGQTEELAEYAAALARKKREALYQNKVFTRGLIEFTNYCKNNCYYCGIRRDNKNAQRYRLTMEEILSCAKQGYELGFRTFVLQGGEDGYFTDDYMVEIISKLKELYPDCAITLSIGEKTKES